MRVPVARLGRVARVGIALQQGLVGLKRLAGIGLVALRVEHLIVIGHADDVLGEVRFLRAGMQREVAVGGGDGVVKFAGLVIGIGRHDDGAAGLLRIGVVDVDFFVLLGGLAVVCPCRAAPRPCRRSRRAGRCSRRPASCRQKEPQPASSACRQERGRAMLPPAEGRRRGPCPSRSRPRPFRA